MRSTLISIRKGISFVIVGSGFMFSSTILADTQKPSSAEETLKVMKVCRQEKSSLDRLDCYDNVWKVHEPAGSDKMNGGVAWQRAMENEQSREHSTLSLLSKAYNTEGGNPMIIITTPALGYKGARPVLMLSCIDNITRLQIAMITPSDKRDINVEISTEKTQFETRWFFRENGFLLEASRGLEGISEIQRLFKSNTLRIKSNSSTINGLTFNIKNLEQEIKPLRVACHW